MSDEKKTPKSRATELLKKRREVTTEPMAPREVTLPPVQSREVTIDPMVVPQRHVTLQPIAATHPATQHMLAGNGLPTQMKAQELMQRATSPAMNQMLNMAGTANLSPYVVHPDARAAAQDLLKRNKASDLKKELTPATQQVMQKRTWIPGGTYDTDPTGKALEAAEDT